MKSTRHIIHTGLENCYDAYGKAIFCSETGQDAQYGIGAKAGQDRFIEQDEIVHDTLTGLVWPRQADLFTYPMTWEETMSAVEELNEQAYLGHTDWRLPNRKELRSLISHGAKKPALPSNLPFLNVFLGWYWTSTTSAMAPAYAWRVHMEGGRMFYGNKKDPGMGWPVRGSSSILPRTGQEKCFDENGNIIDCERLKQDGALQKGVEWPDNRFKTTENGIVDQLTGLLWAQKADLGGLLDWQEALDAVTQLNQTSSFTWRLPNINELESLVDASRSNPALSHDHPFDSVQEAYWSSTTSFFETDWAYALYLHKGAVGVGFKRKKEFHCWPVSNAT